MEKHQDKLYFNKNYFQSYYLLNDLIDMAKKYLTQCTDEEKENVKKDLIKFDELKKEANEKKTESFINVKKIKKNKTCRQLEMIIEFLRFCKKFLHPFVHTNGEKINPINICRRSKNN